MKLVYTLVFILAVIAQAKLGNVLLNESVAQIKKRSALLFRSALLTSAIMVLLFVQYMALTQTAFPFLIVVLLIGALLVSYLIDEIIGAIAGFGIGAKRQKVRVMYVSSGFESSLNHPSKNLVMVISGYFTIASWIAALCIFWANPLGNTNVFTWYAALIFISPTIVRIANTLNLITPIVASENNDDDIKNSNLSVNFSLIIYTTLLFIYPFFILDAAFRGQLPWLPPYWILLLIPMILFLLFAIIPFFIGVNKYKNQKKYLLEWHRNWLDELKHAHELDDEIRIRQKNNELEKETVTQANQNKMYLFLQELGDVPDNQKPNNQAEEVLQLLKDNKDDIIRWDLQMSFIAKLIDTRTAIAKAATPELLKAKIESLMKEDDADLAALDKGSNKIAGIITSGIIALTGVLLKLYHEELMSLLARFKAFTLH